MGKSEVLEYLKREEDTTLEFKEQFNDSVLKTISAFANTNGGVILVGVNNRKEIVGIEINDKIYQNIVNRITDKLGLNLELDVTEILDKNILVIKVNKSQIPISFEGKYYKRIGNTTREMNFEELKRFFQKDLRWERLVENDCSIDEIDKDCVKNFLIMAKTKGRLIVFNGNESIEKIFERLGLMDKGKINNAGILLFGKNPQKYFEHAKIHILRIKNDITIIGDHWIEGNLFNQLREAEEVIKKYINVKYEIKGFERQEIWDYPLEAIREAVANALLHRDYLKYIPIQIKIYDDKIWFYNVGGLPEEWDANKLFTSHPSIPRNPTMFYIFYLAGVVESAGSGIERMIYTLNSMKLPKPKVEANHLEFSLIFMKDIYNRDFLIKVGLNERQINAIMYIKENSKITNKEYRKINEVSDEIARIDLKDLVKKEILLRKGKGRSVYYVLK